MNIAFYILTYNRIHILKQSIHTLYDNTNIHPQESWIIDDGSQKNVQLALVSLAQTNQLNILMAGKNYGIGYSFERVYNLIQQNDELDIACIIESDYIWRKGWLEDVIAVFKASPHTYAIAGTSHPDMIDRVKTHETFPAIMKDIFGSDLKRREELYIPFDLETELGKIKVQGVSNSCGCMILHWGRFKKVVSELERQGINPYYDYKRIMDRAFNKGITHDTRRNASDGHMSSVVSMYGERYNESIQSKGFPFLDICDFSISQHICGGGVNGLIVPEGSTFIVSPHWSDSYLQENPRKR